MAEEAATLVQPPPANGGADPVQTLAPCSAGTPSPERASRSRLFTRQIAEPPNTSAVRGSQALQQPGPPNEKRAIIVHLASGLPPARRSERCDPAREPRADRRCPLGVRSAWPGAGCHSRGESPRGPGLAPFVGGVDAGVSPCRELEGRGDTSRPVDVDVVRARPAQRVREGVLDRLRAQVVADDPFVRRAHQPELHADDRVLAVAARQAAARCVPSRSSRPCRTG